MKSPGRSRRPLRSTIDFFFSFTDHLTFSKNPNCARETAGLRSAWLLWNLIENRSAGWPFVTEDAVGCIRSVHHFVSSVHPLSTPIPICVCSPPSHIPSLLHCSWCLFCFGSLWTQFVLNSPGQLICSLREREKEKGHRTLQGLDYR